MIKNYFKVALRGVLRHKLFTAINVIGLSIGISAALVIYFIVQFEFSFNTAYPDNDRIYRVVSNSSSQGNKYYNGGVCGALPRAARYQMTSLSAVAPFFVLDEFTLGQKLMIPGVTKTAVKFKSDEDKILADDQFFKIFPQKWLAGSAKNALSGPFKVVLTAKQARTYFPKLSYNDIVGREIIYADSVKTTVSGIIESDAGNTDLHFSEIISYSTGDAVSIFRSNMALDQWDSTTPSSQLYLKLANNASAAIIGSQINALLKKNSPPPAAGNSRAFHLQKLSDIHFEEEYATYRGHISSKKALYGLLIVAVFLLLLGCINFINLTTARSAQRTKEIGVRKVIGGSRGQLITQLLCETFLITITAVIVSCLLTPFIFQLFEGFVPVGLTFDLVHRPDIIIFLFALTVVISLLSGCYPAFVLSGYKPIQVLKDRTLTGGQTRNVVLRKTLTVGQLAIAQFFIMATILVSKQIYYALHKDLGYKKDAIIIINTPFHNGSGGSKQVLMDEIKAMPQVAGVSLGGASPSSDNTHSRGAFYFDGKKELKTDVYERFGDENYINLYQIKLLAGRDLRHNDISKALLVNSAYTKVLGFKKPDDAIGKMITYSGDQMQIIGVVGDFYYRSLHSAIQPMVIVTSTNPYFSSTLHIALKPQTGSGTEWSTALAAIQRSWKKLYPEDEFGFNFFDETIAKFYESEQHTITLLNWAAILAVIISSLGLFGLAIYTTTLRTKEIGIRKVLGASVMQIVGLLSTELVWLVALAFIIICPIAWWAMHKWMETFADRTTVSWWIYAASGGAMLFTVLFVSALQTVKAAMANPVNSLKSE